MKIYALLEEKVLQMEIETRRLDRETREEGKIGIYWKS
jgi:hypothetical protein